MNETDLAALRSFITARLHAKSDMRPVADTDSLFISRRLDSLDAMEVVVFMEERFGINFAEIGFDQGLIDSIEAMARLADATKQ